MTKHHKHHHKSKRKPSKDPEPDLIVVDPSVVHKKTRVTMSSNSVDYDDASIPQEMEHDVPEVAFTNSSEQPAESRTQEYLHEEKPQEASPSSRLGCWCWRCLKSIPVKYPRTFSVVFAIIFPLWGLIAIAVVCGYFLAQYEAPMELDLNDLIIANQFTIQSFNLDATLDKIVHLPVDCFVEYLDSKSLGDTDISLLDLTDHFTDGTNEVPGLIETLGEELSVLRSHMVNCSERAQKLVDTSLFIQNKTSFALARSDLSFNWVRCWNETEVGSLKTLHPSPLQIQAAADQPSFYRSVWEEDRERIFSEYLADESIDPIEALNLSILEATGRDHCRENIGGTAWFWFTVMTTVGYGNQAPVTTEGRTMVSTLGFLSILAFGGVLANAGSIVAVIYEDALARCHLKLFRHSWIGAGIWAGISVLWILYLADRTLDFWSDRLEDFEVTRLESLWFAYISITTVGLGDFFLQPEIMFLRDVFRFSVLFLTGFVFLSTFLGKFGDLLGHTFSDSGGTLKERVRKAHLLSMQPDDDDDDDDESEEGDNDRTNVETLRRLLEHDDRGSRSMSTILEEEELLKELMERTAADRLDTEELAG